MNKDKIAAELLKLAKDLIAFPKPKKGDEVTMLNRSGSKSLVPAVIISVIKQDKNAKNSTWFVNADDNEIWIEPYQGSWIEVLGHDIYYYYINLDERGSFYADVRDSNGKTVYEIKAGNELVEDESSIFDDGYMKDKHDLKGLEKYLKELKIIPKEGHLEKGQ